MTIRPLAVDDRVRRMFAPRSIAVLGASANPARVGGRVVRFLTDGGFTGPLYPVNPGRSEIGGLTCYPSAADLPEAPDLGIVTLAAPLAAQAVRDLGARGCRAVICMAAGFREEGPEGAAREADLAAAAREHGVALLGPNTVGYRDTGNSLFPTFATDVALGPLAGSVAVVSQSGALAGYLGGAVAKTRGTGYRWVVDTGNEVDVDIADVIAFLAHDPAVSVIGLITEGCNDGDRLRAALETARERDKPVVALKIGTSEQGARSAASHTGALAGSDRVYDAVFRDHGVHRVRTEHAFLAALELYDTGHLPEGRGVAVFSLSGGIATLMTDLCVERGLDVPRIPPPEDPAIHAALPSARFENPLDLSGQIGSEPQVLASVLDHVLARPEIDSAVLGFAYMLLAPHIADVFVPPIVAARERHRKPILVSGLAHPGAERELRANGIMIEPLAQDAIDALAAVTRAEPGRSVSRATAAAPGRVIESGPAAGRRLTGVPFVDTLAVPTPEDAVAAAAGRPVVLKVEGSATAHKTEQGLVATGLGSAAELAEAHARLVARRDDVGGEIVLQPMLDGVEMLLGVRDDATFGPVVTVGLGGVFTEILGDVAFGLPPLDAGRAEAMLRELRGYPLLTGARGRAPVRTDELVDAIVALGAFAVAHRGRIAEIDVNPFVVSVEPGRSAAVDAVLVWKGDPP